MTRFTADELDRANEAWRCNCGPGSLAAIMGMTLDEVRPHVAAAGFEDKGYTNPTLMLAALRSIDRPYAAVGASAGLMLKWPRFGLARIQWEGRWTQPGVPIRARYRQTHWVGACTPATGPVGIFDVNAMRATSTGAGWVSVDDWSRVIVPAILEGYKGASGGWHITHAIEVERR